MEEGETKKPDEKAPTQMPFLVRHGQKLAALFFWAVLLGGYQIYAWRAGLTSLGAVRELASFMSENPLGWLIYVAIYTLRPLVLFPASLLTIASGFVFGAVLGTALTVVGSNASAMVAYLVGRYFGRDVLESKDEGILQRYARRMRENSFETILVMRFVYLPYDLVNYAAGFLKVRPFPFILATALGSIPGTLSFVLLGASAGALSGEADFDIRILLASAILLVAGLALSQYFKRRESGK